MKMADKTRREFLDTSIKTALGLGLSVGDARTADRQSPEDGDRDPGEVLTGTVTRQGRYIGEDTLAIIRDSTDTENGIAYFPLDSIDESGYQADLLELIRDKNTIREEDLETSIETAWERINSDSYDLEELRHETALDDEQNYSQTAEEWLETGW